MRWNSDAIQVIKDVEAVKNTTSRAALQLGLSTELTNCNNPILHDLSDDLADFAPVIEQFDKSMGERLEQYLNRVTESISGSITEILHDDTMGAQLPSL